MYGITRIGISTVLAICVATSACRFYAEGNVWAAGFMVCMLGLFNGMAEYLFLKQRGLIDSMLRELQQVSEALKSALAALDVTRLLRERLALDANVRSAFRAHMQRLHAEGKEELVQSICKALGDDVVDEDLLPRRRSDDQQGL